MQTTRRFTPRPSFKGHLHTFSRQHLLIPRKAKVHGSFFSPGKHAGSSMIPEHSLRQLNANTQLVNQHNPVLFDTFDEYYIPKDIRELIANNFGAHAPTDIQRRTLSFLLKRNSVALSSPSGTGKTLSYLLPMYLNMQKDRSIYKVPTRICRPRAIILLPTRELCLQVARCCSVFNEKLNFKSIVYLGQPRAKRAWNRMKKSQRLLTDVLITTPRMVRTQIESRRLLIEDLRYIVIDEADLLISRAHQYMATKILNKVRDRNLYEWLWPVQTQYIFVSSMMNTELSRLLENTFSKVLRISTSELHKAPDTLKHRFVPFRSIYQKLDYLCYLLKLSGYSANTVHTPITDVSKNCEGFGERSLVKTETGPLSLTEKRDQRSSPRSLQSRKRVIVFFSEVKACTSVFYKLQNRGFPVKQLHAVMPLKERAQIYKDWSDQKIPILCATDLLSVGIDNRIDVVVNYEMPNHAVKYLRRAGRAGRADSKGLVVSFFTKSQQTIVRAMRQSILTKKPPHTLSNWWANYKPTFGEWVKKRRNAVSKKLVQLVMRRSVPQHLEKAYVAKRGTLQLPWHPKTIQHHGGIPVRQHEKIDNARAKIAHDARKAILARKKKGSARFGRSSTHRFGKSFKRVETGYEGTDRARIMNARPRGTIGDLYG